MAAGASTTITSSLYSNGSLTTFNGGGTLTRGGATDNIDINLAVNDGGSVVLNKTSNAGTHAIGDGLTINAGIVQLSGTGGDQIYDGNSVAINNSAFDLSGRNETITNLLMGKSTGGHPIVYLNGGTLTLLGGLSYNGGGTTTTTGGTNGDINPSGTPGGSLHFAGANPFVAIGTRSSTSEDLEINVPMTGTTGMTFSGATAGVASGVISLNAQSTYSGATTLKSAKLNIGVVDALPVATALTLSSGAILNLGANQTVGSLSGGAGTTITLEGKVLGVSNITSTTFSGNFVSIGTADGLAINGSGTLTLAGGTSTMGSLGAYAGGIILDGGSLSVSSLGGTGFGGTSSLFASGSGNVLARNGAKLTTVDSPELHNGAQITVDGIGTNWTNNTGGAGATDTIWIGRAGHSNQLTVQNSGAVNATGSLDVGNLSLGSNPGTGNVLVLSGGNVTVGSTLLVDAGSAMTIDGGGTVTTSLLRSGTPQTISSTHYGEPVIYLGTTGGTAALTVGTSNASSEFDGTIWGYGGLTKTGSGTFTFGGTQDNVALTLTSNAGVTSLAKASSSGVHALAWMTLNGGTVQLGGTGSDQIWDGSVIAVNGGTFDLNGRSEGIGGLSGAGGIVTNNAANTTSTLTIVNGGGGVSAASFQDGAGGAGHVAITKSGSGLSTLTGNSVISGPFTVNGGGVVLDGGSLTTSAPGFRSIAVLNPGTTFTVQNGATVNNPGGDPVIDNGGMLLVTGAHSTITNAGGQFNVGDFGNGSMSIQDGANGVFNTLVIGLQGSTGNALVQTGGTVTANNTTMGAFSGGGQATVTGPGSSWNTTYLIFGGGSNSSTLVNSSGSVAVSNGGAMNVTTTAFAASGPPRSPSTAAPIQRVVSSPLRGPTQARSISLPIPSGAMPCLSTEMQAPLHSAASSPGPAH